LIVDEGMINVY